MKYGGNTMTMNIEFKEKTFPIRTLLINEYDNESKWNTISDTLDHLFDINTENNFDDRTSRNLYFYLDPEKQEFISGQFDEDLAERKRIKEEYFELLKRSYTNQTGYINLSEEIFGIVESEDRVRTDMTDNELKFKFLQKIPINVPLELFVLRVDRIIPEIIHLETIIN